MGSAPRARPSVRALAFSLRGTYLLTWEKLSEGVAENLRLWRTADGAFVCGWAQKLLGEASQGVERITRFIAQQQRAKGR